MSELVESHRRYLPHCHESDKVISLTWRLEGDLPQLIKDTIREMQSVFKEISDKENDPLLVGLNTKYHILIEKYDQQLGEHKPTGIDLTRPDIGEILASSFHFYHDKLYDLQVYCIMPNHVHLLIKPLEVEPHKEALISDIVRRIKGYTAKQIIKAGFEGHKVWRADYFDRQIRNDKDYYYTIEYILCNPLKANLAEKQKDWPYSYSKWW